MAETEYRLTTKDNPFNPFTQFDKWFLFDVEKGYNTCGYLARILNEGASSDDNSAQEIEDAIDEIIRNDFMNIYLKVKK